MSKQTNEARAARERSGAAWAAHVLECPACARSRRSACQTGRGLLETLRAANTEVERQTELDQNPMRGQLSLW